MRFQQRLEKGNFNISSIPFFVIATGNGLHDSGCMCEHVQRGRLELLVEQSSRQVVRIQLVRVHLVDGRRDREPLDPFLVLRDGVAQRLPILQ